MPSEHLPRWIFSLALVALPVWTAFPVVAQDAGTVAGVVVDAEAGEPLPGANVTIAGTTTGTATDLNGHYRIPGLAPGTYDVVFSFIGFQQTTVTGVEVEAGKTTEVDIALAPETEQLGEVVVTAEAARDSEAGLLRERQKALAVSDAVSAEAMSQAGLGTAAEALTRVTGASVADNKYVVVRGLGGRYSRSQLNGASLPSADPDRNAAQLDLFPSELLASVVVRKTFTPDQAGDFSGGSIDIRTRSFPTDLTAKFTVSSAYNTQSSFVDYLTGPSSSTDWLGFDNGLRAIPSLLRGGADIPSPQFARNDPELAQRLDAYSTSFSDVMVPLSARSGMDMGYALSLGNQLDVLGVPVGFSGSASYDRGYSAYSAGTTAQYRASDPTSEALSTNYRFTDTRGTETASWGVRGALAFDLHPHHELSVNALRTQDGEQLGRYLVGPFPKNIPAESVLFETYVLQYTERSVGSYQLRGEHLFPRLKDARLNWSGTYSRTRQEEPDLRFFFDEFTDIANGDGSVERVYTINLGSSNATPPTRIFRDLTEDNWEGKLDVEIPLRVGLSAPAQAKFGAAYLDNGRAFRERKFDYRFDNGLFREVVRGANTPELFRSALTSFFGGEHLGVVDTTEAGRFEFGNVIRDGTVDRNNYDGTRRVLGLYGMVEVPLLERLRLVGGLRFEKTDIRVESRGVGNPSGRLSTEDYLPSLNLIYTLRDDMNVRGAFSRTLARPTYREIAPFQSFSFAGGPVVSGNPELRRTLITNYDARWEWFVRPGEVLAVSAFYKQFQDPIERVLISDNDQITYENVESAQVAGIEVEARKRMGWLAPFLDDLMLSANLALIDARADVPPRELEVARDGGFDISSTRPFQDQSPYVLNLGLSYDRAELGTAVNVSYNRFGKRLTEVSYGGTPNIFEFGRDDLGVSVSQRLFEGITAKVAVDNLLDAAYVEGQEYRGERFDTHRYKLGRTFKLSLSYDL